MNNNGKELILSISGGIALLFVGWGFMQLLVALASIIPTVITGVFFVILQISVLLLSVIIFGLFGFLIIQVILNILSKFEESFSKQIESLRRQINKLTNNIASEVLAIITAFLVALSQDHLSTNDITKYSIGILSGVYLFFAIQLIKSDNRRDKFIGIFFYVFPLLIATAYYATDFQSVIQVLSRSNTQDIVLPAAALVTLLLAFYYSFNL